MPSAEIIRARGKSPLNEDELRSLAAKAWHDLGIVVFKPEDIRNWADKQHLINLAERVFGKRRTQQQGARR